MQPAHTHSSCVVALPPSALTAQHAAQHSTPRQSPEHKAQHASPAFGSRQGGHSACQPGHVAACCLQSDEELLLLEAVEIYGEQHSPQQAHLPAQLAAATAVSGRLLHSTGLLVVCKASS